MLPFDPARFGNAALWPVASIVAFDLSYVTKNSDETDGTTYTFSAQSIGVADATRQIVICTGARRTTAFDITSITVGGVTATVLNNCVSGNDGVRHVMAKASVPTGTTGDVVITWNQTVLRCEIAIYRVLGTTTAISDAGTDIVDNTTPTKTFTVPTGGGMICGAISFANAVSATPSNITENIDEVIVASTSHFYSGSDTSHAGSSTAYSWTYNLAQNGTAAGWLSIGP